jgi:hypothetical protein
MARTTRLLALIACFALPGASTAQVKKYDVKSGIVAFETVMTMGKTEIKNKSVVTFDDWGAREKRDTYAGGKLKETFLCDGKNQIKIGHDDKTAWIVGQCSRGTELRFDWSEVSERDKKQGKATQLPPMTVAGKKCQAFEIKDARSTSRFAGFGKVTLYTEVASSGTKTVIKAVKFEENAAVPADALQVPAGYTTKKWP